MERKNAWKSYTQEELSELGSVTAGYIDFISRNKTERECVAAAIDLARKGGYISLSEAMDAGKPLAPGAKVYAQHHNKTIMFINVGEEPLEAGLNILGAHIDSPRLDIKQNPLYEDTDLAYLDTHYYGGIKKYQWVTLPLAIHGVIAKKDGTVTQVVVGEDEADPVFCVTDLLPHLGDEQLKKAGGKVVEGEALDVLVGGQPLVVEKADGDEAGEEGKDSEGQKDAWEEVAEKEPVKAHVIKLLMEKYGIEEEDFLSAELEVVPAGNARELGFDRSMVLGYGQDDRVCSYTSLMAQLDIDKTPKRTAVTILVDKEEIGSVGATGMHSQFFENTIAEVMQLAGESGSLPLRRALSASQMLSSDVSAGYDPSYTTVFEKKNSAYLGRGLVFNKYTGARGKSGSNDASAEYIARVRRVMDDAKVAYQTAELGKVDAGGGGTIAYIPARYGMDVIDSGVPVLSMHAPWEATSKADIYEAYKGYKAFLQDA